MKNIKNLKNLKNPKPLSDLSFQKTGNFHLGPLLDRSNRELVNLLTKGKSPKKGELADVLITLFSPSESKIRNYKEKGKIVMTDKEFLVYAKEVNPEYFL